LPPAEVAEAQRDRMLRAMTAAVAALGYANVRISDVAKRGKVSRQSFYAQFTDKEACFLAAHEHGIGTLITRVTESAADASGRDPREQLRAGLRTYFEMTAEEPEFAYCMLVELQAIGPAGLETRLEAHRQIAAVLSHWHAGVCQSNGWPPVPATQYSAAVGAVHDLVFDVVARGQSGDAPGLEDAAYSAVAGLLEIPRP
jgi:AcrR family transcriptional regulator